MIKRKFSICLFLLLLIDYYPHFLNAKSELIIYSLNNSQIPSYLKDYISSIDLQQIDNKYTLFINGKEISSSNNLVFSYSLDSNANIILTYVLPDSVNIKYSCIESRIIASKFEIFMDDGIQTVKFYPNSNKNEYSLRTATLKDGKYDFGSFNAVLEGQNFSFNLVLNNTENKAYVTKNGVVQKYDLKSGGVVSRIFLETHVNYHTLNLTSTKKLTPKSFTFVKNSNYSNSEIDNIVKDEKLTLTHKKTGLSVQDNLVRIISFWKRIGENDYDTNYSEQLQVVAQYNEAAGEFARSKEREYIVLGNNYSYDKLSSEVKKVEEKVYYDLYQNVHWYDSNYVNSTSFPESKSYRLIQYSTRTGSWGSYSGYNYDSYSACSSNQYCGYAGKVYYSKSTRTKTIKSQLQKSTGAVNSWSSYVDSSTKPKDTDSCRYQTYYKYTCKKSILSTTVYSYISYSTGEQGPCSSGYKISAKKTGYRYGAVTWSDYKDVTYCSNSASYSKCRSIDTPSYGSWSTFSGYTYTSCTENDVTQCKATTKYAYRYITFNDWTNFQNTTSAIESNKLKEVKYRYNDGSMAWESYKGTSNTIGVSPYYTGNSSKNSYSEYVDKNFAKIVKVNVGDLYNQKEANIISIANDIAKNAQYKAIYDANSGNILYDDLLKIYNNNNSIYLSSNTLAYNSFLNSNIFLPYIYVKDHYRAVARDMNVGGYEGSLSNVSTISIQINQESNLKVSKSVIPLSRDTKIVYFDNLNPFSNYDKLPNNWKDSIELLNKIRMANKKNYKYRYIYENGVITKY